MQFVVNCLEPGLHVYRVTLHITDLPAGKHHLTLPVWTPGAYEIQDFARHLFQIDASLNETPLELAHTAKNVWEFDTYDTATVIVRYQVYAYELGVDTSHLDQTHAYWNGAQLFFLVDDYKDLPIEVVIEAPPEWHVSTGLERLEDHPYRFRAANYDLLIDSPVEVGTHRRLTFTVDNVPHEVAIWGHGNEDTTRLLNDIEAIVRTQRELFGGLPYAHYTFILHLSDRRGGGLEHLNSTTCSVHRFSFRPWKEYRRVLELIAHEFFHLWNVKRIHPEMLGPFDYNREVYTHLLWAMEGFTDYYAYLSLRRAGLFTLKDYCGGLAERMQRYEQLPGRFVQSLGESSFDTWIKLYKPDADSPNRTISYYLKGDLVGTCLDLEIRQRTENRASLDDVLRRLYDRYGQHGVGFPESVYQDTVEEVAQSSFEEFFQSYIWGTDPVPFDHYLAYAGLLLERRYKNPDGDENEAPPSWPWLGIATGNVKGQDLVVEHVYVNGPARDRINPGDRVLALNGFEIPSNDELGRRLRLDYHSGDTVEVTVVRRGELKTVTVVLEDAPPNDYRIVANPDAPPSARQLFETWLKASWDDAASLSAK
ncbi:peptidase, M61 (glycyl aminopeptidase) family protein [Sulfobacillus acidophilus TPY]|nr:peptidase, M61 (glycyl aminopeptidase) family protein [Sulfobacillus acidophilus TPY]